MQGNFVVLSQEDFDFALAEGRVHLHYEHLHEV